ncbi:MAG: NAD(P)(+) transhydrogenase (Re/Si-specific) subunit alpha, partial [Mesorhizobium sp.]
VVTTANGVKIVGHINVPGRVAASASLLYARNLFAFVETLVDKTTKTLAINPDDELVKATMLTDGGQVVHPAFAGKPAVMIASAEPAAAINPALPKKAAASRKAAAPKSPANKSKGIA